MSEDECSGAFKYEDLEAKFNELEGHVEKNEDQIEENADELEKHEETHHDLLITKIENAKLEKQLEYEKFKNGALTDEVIKARDTRTRTDRSRTGWTGLDTDHGRPENLGPFRTRANVPQKFLTGTDWTKKYENLGPTWTERSVDP